MATLIDWSLETRKLRRKLLQLARPKLVKMCKYKKVLSTGAKKDIVDRLINANAKKSVLGSAKSNVNQSKRNRKSSKAKQEYNRQSELKTRNSVGNAIKLKDKQPALIKEVSVSVAVISSTTQQHSLNFKYDPNKGEKTSIVKPKSADMNTFKVDSNKCYHHPDCASSAYLKSYLCPECHRKFCGKCCIIHIYDATQRHFMQSLCKDCYPTLKYNSFISISYLLFKSVCRNKEMEINIITLITRYTFDVKTLDDISCENKSIKCDQISKNKLQLPSAFDINISLKWIMLFSNKLLIICDQCHSQKGYTCCRFFNNERKSYIRRCANYSCELQSIYCENCNESEIKKYKCAGTANRFTGRKCERIICGFCRNKGSSTGISKCNNCNEGLICGQRSCTTSSCYNCHKDICERCIGGSGCGCGPVCGNCSQIDFFCENCDWDGTGQDPQTFCQ